MMPTSLPAAAVIAGLFVALSPALAEDPSSYGAGAAADGNAAAERDEFSALDLNGDGVVSRGEIYLLANLARRFNEADTNGDGEIDRSEFSAFEMRKPEDRVALPPRQGTLGQSQLFEAVDTNGNDVIDSKEAQTYTELENRFPQADENGDGVVDRAEFGAFQYRQQYEQDASPDALFE